LPALFAFDYLILAGYVQGIKKNPRSRIEADAMFLPIAAALGLVPDESHLYIQ
jgi:hypothetical protein